MKAETDGATYAVVFAVAALTVGVLDRFEEATVVATDCSRGWNDFQDINSYD